MTNHEFKEIYNKRNVLEVFYTQDRICMNMKTGHCANYNSKNGFIRYSEESTHENSVQFLTIAPIGSDRYNTLKSLMGV